MQTPSRRDILALGGVAAMFVGGDVSAQAGPATPGERANMKLVTDFCAAWTKHDIDVLMPYLADTISYRMTETTPPIVGRSTFHDRIKGILDRLTSIEFAVVETWAKGPMVFNERRDTLISPQGTRRFHAVGVFFLVDSKIVEWADYIIKEG